MSEVLCWLGFHKLKYISTSKAFCIRSKRCRGKLHRISDNEQDAT